MALRAKMVGREALTRKIRELAPEMEKEYSTAIEVGTKELAEAIQARAPREDGEYANSIQAAKLSSRPQGKAPVGIRETKDPSAWGIFAEWYWRFLEFGTRAHIIKPRHAKQLRFTLKDGTRVAADQVSHPGARARPHIFPTYRQYRKRIRSRVARAINKAAKKVWGK